MSAMTSAASWGFSMAEPPYLMTMVLPVTCLSHGMASYEDLAGAYGYALGASCR